jgi:hypothetical protein
MIEPDALKTQIRLAFADVEPPPHWCLTRGTEGHEPALLAQEFAKVLDRHWEELSQEFLDRAPDGYGSALSFFSDEAFRFYLPAYLVAMIDRNLQQADPIFHLTHGLSRGGGRFINPRRYGARTARDEALHRLAVFTPAEAGAIRAFLEWFAASSDCLPPEREDIREAIATFWAHKAQNGDTAT